MIVYCHSDPRFPFLWETPNQPSARWHVEGEGPAHYLADTPDGAWAEFLRHEGITDPTDLEGIQRALWAVELKRQPREMPELPPGIVTGGMDSYPRCQQEARRMRGQGTKAIKAPSAALKSSGATGWVVDGGLRDGPAKDGTVYVLYGPQPRMVGWMATDAGRPPSYLLHRVRNL